MPFSARIRGCLQIVIGRIVGAVGVLLGLAGGELLLSFVGFGIAGLPGHELPPATRVLVAFGLQGASFATLNVGTRILRRGRRHFLSAGPLTMKSSDDFVLYLRPFDSDAQLARIAVRTRGIPYVFPMLGPASKTEEEQICDAVKPFGSPVAVGRPNERMPTLGARRETVPDETWQREVLDMMNSARLVVLTLGTGAGLLWEIRQAIGHLDPERIVLLVPMDELSYGTYREDFSRTFPRGLPEYPQGFRRRHFHERVRGAIWFDDDWTPNFARFDTTDARANESRPLESAFVYGLEPVYRRLGAPWPGVSHPPFMSRKFAQRWATLSWPLAQQLPAFYLRYTVVVLLILLVVYLQVDLANT